jgi:hypothetical protein
VVDYFEDRQTGSIYSLRELGQMLRSRQLEVREVTGRFKQLPYSTCLVLAEAETIAARAEDDQGHRWVKPDWL